MLDDARSPRKIYENMMIDVGAGACSARFRLGFARANEFIQRLGGFELSSDGRTRKGARGLREKWGVKSLHQLPSHSTPTATARGFYNDSTT